MRLSTQRRQRADSQVDLTKIYKTLTFGANRANDERDTAISNFQENIHKFLCKFSRFFMSVSSSIFGLLTPNLGIL